MVAKVLCKSCVVPLRSMASDLGSGDAVAEAQDQQVLSVRATADAELLLFDMV